MNEAEVPTPLDDVSGETAIVGVDEGLDAVGIGGDVDGHAADV